MGHQEKKQWSFKGRLEQLESRALLAGHGFGPALAEPGGAFFGPAAQSNLATLAQDSAFHQALAFHSSSSTSSSDSGDDGSGDDGSGFGDCSHGDGASTSLTGSLTDGNGNTATITYQVGNLLGTSEAVITVTGDTVDEGTAQALAINGTTIGNITLDSTGTGTLIVPVSGLGTTVAATSTVTFGSSFAGALATATSTSGDQDKANLSGSLTDTAGDTATVTYQTGKLLGTKEAVFTVTGDTSAEGTSQEVVVDGTDVGTIAIDSTGAGTLIVPVASLAATPVAGSTVTLGSLTGSLATSTSTTSGGSDSGGCSHGENSTLTASISDTGGDTATVTAQFGRIAGAKDVVVTVAGDTSAEGTSQDVTIDGTDAGSISIDSNGSGTLIVPLSTFASTPASGSTIVVGLLNGTFASSSSSSGSSSSSISFSTASSAAHDAVFSSFARHGRR
jgi:trimeric autotransporter adhesin